MWHKGDVQWSGCGVQQLVPVTKINETHMGFN